MWADMLTRWAAKPKVSVLSKKIPKFKTLMMAPINPGIDGKLDWPEVDEILKSQSNSDLTPPRRFRKSANGYQNSSGVTWIPADDEKMKLRLIIAAHTGIGGHRGVKVTEASIKSHFFWSKMDDDITKFITSCIHCLSTRTGEIIPRPLGHALHAVEPNKMLHFDFCYMSPGKDDFTYVLVLKDDFSGYVWLEPTNLLTQRLPQTSY